MGENLHVDLIHLYPLENAGPHKTDKFELVHEDDPTPVLRRGMKFSLAISFGGRGFDRNKDVVRLIFSYGSNARAAKGTQAIVRLDPKKTNAEQKKRWTAGILAEGPDSLTVEVYSPPDSVVGKWRLQVETGAYASNSKRDLFDFHNGIYLLFNPWNCDDLVYMPEERLLDEYIMTDVGKIWVGPYGSSRGREWVFGQFDKCALLAAMLMLERSGMADSTRGDPIRTARIISKLVNSNDDNGILVGRWDGEYDDGTAPSAWPGSVPILEQFLETQYPVSYGQCWVFSGVVTSICRALGIPSRVVSNLVSAHDANSTLTVDKYYDVNNEEIEGDPNNFEGEDSIWNYHVWCDVWMARPDLPKGYGGWQAVDATPQETSDGVYQCGPASLEAIRQGQVGFNYDVTFMIASVNADLVRWKEDMAAEMGYTRIFCNKYHIGRMILTKKPFLYDPNGDKDREDITLQYKAKEGTEDERVSLMNAVRATATALKFFDIPRSVKEDVTFELVDLDKIKIGEDFNVTINIKNTSNEIRSIKAVLSSASVFYTGVKSQVIKKAEGSFKVQPNATEQLRMSVKADEYLDKLVEYSIMKVHAIATVEETSETWADEDDFQVVKPTIRIKIPSTLVPVKTPTRITLKFTNPLKKVLTNCKFHLAGPNLIRSLVIPYPDVKPGALVKADTDITIKKPGDQKLVATFSSKELLDITGTVKFEAFDDDE